MRGRLRIPASLINVIGLIAALIVIFVFFSSQLENFHTGANLVQLARQAVIVTMAALGMTYIIISGGIDLSVGSMVAFVSVVIAFLLNAGYSPAVAAFGGIAAGAAAGLLNGFLITRLRVGPFIVTLGTLLIIRGAAKGIAHEQKIDAPSSILDNLLALLGPENRWMLVPPGVWLTALAAVVMGLVLRYTVFGRQVIAVGSNEQAARLCGINVERVKLYVFALGGLFAGLAGLLMYSRLTVGDPTVAIGLELDVIAAAVIGGASLSGGEGTILGSVLGALIMATIRAGTSQMGWSNWIQEIVTGAIIVVAVALDRLRVSKT